MRTPEHHSGIRHQKSNSSFCDFKFNILASAPCLRLQRSKKNFENTKRKALTTTFEATPVRLAVDFSTKT